MWAIVDVIQNQEKLALLDEEPDVLEMENIEQQLNVQRGPAPE